MKALIDDIGARRCPQPVAVQRQQLPAQHVLRPLPRLRRRRGILRGLSFPPGQSVAHLGLQPVFRLRPRRLGTAAPIGLGLVLLLRPARRVRWRGGLLARCPCRRHLLPRGPGDGGGLHLAAGHLPGELTGIAGRFPCHEHLRAVALPGQRDIARRRPPVMRVIEVGVVQGLALALVDRPGIAVPEPLEVVGRPRHHTAAIECRGELAGARIEAGDGADIAVVDPQPLVGVGELHPVAGGKIRRPVLRLEPHVRTGQRTLRAPHLAQLGIERVHVAVGVGEHEPLGVGRGRGVARPGRDQGLARIHLVVGPGDRPGPVERGHGLGEPSLRQVVRRLPLPIDALPRHRGDLRRAVPLRQLGEQPAALDAGELAVIAGEDQLGAGLARFRQQFAGDARVQHRRLVDDDDGAAGPTPHARSSARTAPRAPCPPR